MNPPFSFARRAPTVWIIGVVALLLVCGGVFALILSGRTRRATHASPAATDVFEAATSSAGLVPRHLDGVPVTPELANAAPWAVMIDNQVDARPQSGVSSANVVIESPVEGGITRLMAMFAPTSTLSEVGPIRSARPYFVDWAQGWRAMYAHVGGSPEALDRITSLGTHFNDANEMMNGWAFWRDDARVAPHSTMTNGTRMESLSERKGYVSTTLASAWHFLDEAASSTTPGTVLRVAVPYGGSYNVVWKFDKEQTIYTRSIGGKKAIDKSGSAVQAKNIIVIKTDAQILDDKGRLRVRTTGSGDAIAYRDGNKFSLRWRRTPGEPIRFETVDGIEYLLRPGTTWIEVTTDDTTFAGLEK